jgi:hypothetical protein
MLWGLAHTLQFSCLHHHDIGCPTRRGFRRVGTMDPARLFIRHRHEL